MRYCVFSISIAILVMLLSANRAFAAACSVESGPTRTALLELYTSEGCSSCPPADRWLGHIAASGMSTRKVVPLALHVDYWDYIGWQDKFAKPLFAERQRAQAGLGFVYTPQVMLDGKDFHDWRDAARFETSLAEINRTPAQALIMLGIDRGQDSLEVNARIQTAAQADLYIALYENGLASQIRAGENNGALLHHDYVVREWLGPYPVNQKSQAVQQRIMIRNDWKSENLGVAAFVQRRGNQEILQAVATKLCD